MPSSRILSPKATSSTNKAASSCSKKSSTFRCHKAINKSPSITTTYLGKIVQKKNRTSLQRLWQFTEDPCVAALAPQAVLCRGCGVPKLLDSRGKAEYYDGFWTKHKVSCTPCHKLIPGGHPEHPLIEGMPALTDEVRQEIQRQIKLNVKRYEEHLKKKKPAIDPETLEKISSSRPLAVTQTATLSPAPQGSPEHLTIPPSPRWPLTDATASESQHDLSTSNSTPLEESTDEIEWEGSLGQQVYHRMQELRIQHSFLGRIPHGITNAGTYADGHISFHQSNIRQEHAQFHRQAYALPGVGFSSDTVRVRKGKNPIDLLATAALQRLALDSTK